MNRDNARSSRLWFRSVVTQQAPVPQAFGILTRFVIIVSLSLLLISKANPALIEPLRETVAAPLRSMLTVTAGTMSAAFFEFAASAKRMFASGGLEAEHGSTTKVAELSARIADLQHAKADLARENADLQREIAGLRTLLPMAGNRSYKLRAAFVIGGSTNAASSRVLIAAGRDDGIRPGYPVMMGARLLGRVHVVHGATAVVVRLSDRLSRVPVVVGAGETRALLVGSGDGGATLELIGQGPSPSAGDPVTTSGIGGVFPRGLMIGRVQAAGDVAISKPPVRVSLDSELAYEPVAGVMMIEGAIFDQPEPPGKQSAIPAPGNRAVRIQTAAAFHTPAVGTGRLEPER